MDKNLFLLFMFSAVLISSIEAEPIEDKQALLDFLNKMNHSPHLNWDENSSVCQTWRGVTCNTDGTRVIAIRLPGAGLTGSIPPNTLARLSALETVSLRLNGITGFFPDDFSELKNLTSLYLQSNKFSGPLPLDFSVWSNLSVLNLSNNSFNGSIPFSISNLTHLGSLVLANNSLSGEIPDLNIHSLHLLNLANNNLSGVVPKSLLRFPSSAFSGNNLASNTSSTLPPAFPMHPPYNFPPKKSKGLSETALLGIIIGVCALGFAVIAVVMILCCYDFASSGVKESVKLKKNEVSMKAESSASQDKNKIVFFEDCNLAFDLEDLLRASAEILGKGTFGTTYKAALEDATTVAVKRLKEVTVGKREFEQQMEVVGKIKHENVDTLRAYYYSKDEKLVVSDYYQQGSVSSILHGKRGEGRTNLDWDSRLKIAIGTARGIAHIHTQQGGKLVHGNIKASNIFLNSQGYGCVSDIGLATLMSSIPPPGTSHKHTKMDYIDHGGDRRRRRRNLHSSNQHISFIFLYLTFQSFITLVGASIHDYQNETFIRRANSFFFHGGSEGLYASKPISFNHSLSSSQDNFPTGKSFIRFESITFRRTKESAEKASSMQQKTGLVEAIIIKVRDRNNIGGVSLNSDAICCTPELAKEGSCKLGEVIIRENPGEPNGPKRLQTFFEGQNEETNMVIQTVEINSTGMYYLYFMFCDPQLKDTVISGRTVWRNPDGYLPGKMTPLMTFYGLMSLAYIFLGLVWFLWFVQYWKDVIQLHYHITAVISLGMCEMALWYFEYANFNSTGSRPMVITVWAVTFTAVKKTVSRLLLLVVSMGFGVVRPTLGGLTSKVILLGVVYFVASEALELVEHLGNINDFSGKARLILVLPVALLDACFILWIFSSLSKTLEKLQIRKSTGKLELYRKFTNSLAVTVLLSVIWIGYELYFNASDPLGELWRRAWVIPAFWTLLAYALLIVICILWAPSRNPTRYSYSEETGDDFDEEAVTIVGSGVKVSEMATRLERKDRKASSTSLATDHHVFGVVEEEDKRE